MDISKTILLQFRILLLGGLSFPPVLAHTSASDSSQSAEDSEVNRVLVTAQKREQLQKDVPISISVIDGERIDKEVIIDLEELSYHQPNLTINESGISTNLFIRGVGSGVNFGFEQSVGNYVDGVYYGRARNARAALFDIERVEILKGPQDTLFGKNSIAGALNISTRKPTSETEGYVEIYTEPELGGNGVRAVWSGSVSDNLSTRIGLMRNSEEGWIYNRFKEQDEPNKTDSVFRSSWLWQPSEKVELFLKLEFNEFDTLGRNTVATILPETLPFYTLALAADPEFQPGFTRVKSMGGIPGMGDEFANNQSDTILLNFDFDLGWATFTSSTGYTYYEVEEHGDADLLPISLVNLKNRQKYQQISQELRIISNLQGEFEYIAGFYFQENNLDSIRRADINGFEVGFPFAGRRHNTFLQDTTSRAVFGQINWKPVDNWIINFGLRVSDVDKRVFKELYIAELLNDNVNTDPAANGAFRANLNIVPHTFSDDSSRDGVPINFDPVRKESNTSPSLSLQYSPEENAMWYVSLAKGFKGGGFDEDNTMGDPLVEEFEDENVIALESGFKLIYGNRSNLNLAVFRNEFDNLQVSTFDGVAGFNVGNAAKSINQGIEIEGRHFIEENLSYAYSIAYLDAYYDDYQQGQCTNAQSNCNSMGFQDLTGRPLQYAPEWSVALGANYQWDFADSWFAELNLSANYSSRFEIPGDLDPVLAQPSFTKLNTRFQFGDSLETWWISLMGKNLTNELTTSWGNDIPLAPGGFFQHIDPPRSIELQLHWSF